MVRPVHVILSRHVVVFVVVVCVCACDFFLLSVTESVIMNVNPSCCGKRVYNNHCFLSLAAGNI